MLKLQVLWLPTLFGKIAPIFHVLRIWLDSGEKPRAWLDDAREEPRDSGCLMWSLTSVSIVNCSSCFPKSITVPDPSAALASGCFRWEMAPGIRREHGHLFDGAQVKFLCWRTSFYIVSHREVARAATFSLLPRSIKWDFSNYLHSVPFAVLFSPHSSPTFSWPIWKLVTSCPLLPLYTSAWIYQGRGNHSVVVNI